MVAELPSVGLDQGQLVAGSLWPAASLLPVAAWPDSLSNVQASTSTIAATVDALSERLDLGKVFRNAPTGASYTLRGIICYFSHHYQVSLCRQLVTCCTKTW